MKSEEALEIVSGYAGRLNRRGSRATALRIVLAMAKAARTMATECDNAAIYIAQGTPSAVEGPVTRALDAFRKASGGDAP